MSLSAAELFDAGEVPIDGVESGTSVLLTGDDADALESLFAALVAAEENQESIVVATDDSRSLERALDSARRGAGDRLSMVVADDSASGDHVETIDDLGDLTQLGMLLSNMAMEPKQAGKGFRSGIFICSTVCAETDDIRSVYRFINTNFLSDLRRSDAIGVCAIDMSARLETDVESMVSSMESSFDVRMHVRDADRRSATVGVSGLPDVEEFEVSL
jgi:hypothetical protein